MTVLNLIGENRRPEKGITIAQGKSLIRSLEGLLAIMVTLGRHVSLLRTADNQIGRDTIAGGVHTGLAS